MGQVFFYDMPGVGRIGISARGEYITGVFFSGKVLRDGQREEETPLIRQAAGQIREYLSGERKEFNLPVALRGTDFQVEVWKALTEIPYGQTRTYGQIAARIGRPKACRAVGLANNRNPVSIIVPCHRVIGSGGKLVGYGGGLAVKEYLLDLEKGK